MSIVCTIVTRRNQSFYIAIVWNNNTCEYHFFNNSFNLNRLYQIDFNFSPSSSQYVDTTSIFNRFIRPIVHEEQKNIRYPDVLEIATKGSYIKQTFHGVVNNMQLDCNNGKIVITIEVKQILLDWYNIYLLLSYRDKNRDQNQEKYIGKVLQQM